MIYITLAALVAALSYIDWLNMPGSAKHELNPILRRFWDYRAYIKFASTTGMIAGGYFLPTPQREFLALFFVVAFAFAAFTGAVRINVRNGFPDKRGGRARTGPADHRFRGRKVSRGHKRVVSKSHRRQQGVA